MSSLRSVVLMLLVLSVLVVGAGWIGLQLPVQGAAATVQSVRTRWLAAAPTPDADSLAQARLAPVHHTVADPAALDPVRAVSQDHAYYIAVSYVQTVTVTNSATGQPRLIVTAVLGNAAAQPVQAAQADLTLITRDGRRYSANPPEPHMQPSLIDTPIAPESTLYGFVAFDDIPDPTGALLTWCVDGAAVCRTPIQSSLP